MVQLNHCLFGYRGCWITAGLSKPRANPEVQSPGQSLPDVPAVQSLPFLPRHLSQSPFSISLSRMQWTIYGFLKEYLQKVLSLTGERSIWWLDINLCCVKGRHNLKPSAGVISTAISKNWGSRFQPIVFFLIPAWPRSSSCFPFYTELKRKVFSSGVFSVGCKALKQWGIWVAVLPVNPCGALRCYRR